MKRILATAVSMLIFAGLPAAAVPPEAGFAGVISFSDGSEGDRISCGSLEQLKAIFKAGHDNDNAFFMSKKASEFKKVLNVRGEPLCRAGKHGEVRILGEPVELGLIDNPIGDAKIYAWGLHVDRLPQGDTQDFWILYLDTKDKRPHFQTGTPI